MGISLSVREVISKKKIVVDPINSLRSLKQLHAKYQGLRLPSHIAVTRALLPPLPTPERPSLRADCCPCPPCSKQCHNRTHPHFVSWIEPLRSAGSVIQINPSSSASIISINYICLSKWNGTSEIMLLRRGPVVGDA